MRNLQKREVPGSIAPNMHSLLVELAALHEELPQEAREKARALTNGLFKEIDRAGSLECFAVFETRQHEQTTLN